MIPVTRPYMPPQDELNRHINDIYNSKQLTNEGPKLLELKQKLKSYLDLENISIVANGTLALQLSIKALNLKGEIITTPFSYVATSSSILWENCIPVFVDVKDNDLTINEELIEEKINKNTSCILATHVYGFPCNVSKIEKIAKKYNLKVIYDGAHAFGVKLNNESIFNFGDLSTCSTHATKLFHTVEGGFVSSKNKELIEKIDKLKNFGHTSPYTFSGIGINAKMSEIHSIFGLINLNYIDQITQNRKKYFDLYNSFFVDNKKIKIPESKHQYSKNYSYYPIIFTNKEELIHFENFMKNKGIITRRYFYPSLDTIYDFKNECPISRNIANRILCLPVLSDFDKNTNQVLNNSLSEFLA